MKAGFKPDPKAASRFSKYLDRIAYITDQDNPEGIQNLLYQSAKRFIKNAADITPPASGKANPGAKKAGEKKILGDLLKIAAPVKVSRKQAKEIMTKADDLLAIHAKGRDRSNGGVNPRARKEKVRIAESEFNRAAKILFGRVGWLAAGLNAAAKRLGFKLPAYIARHGEKFGEIEVRFTPTSWLIRIVQNVPFSGNVRGYARRWEAAFLREVTTLRKMQIKIEEKL